MQNIMLSQIMPDSPLNTPVTLFSGVASEKIDDYPLIDLLSSMQLQWSAKIWELRNEQDEEKQKTMKKKLPCFTPSGTFVGGHGQEDMISHSGLLCIDIDVKDNTHIPDFGQLVMQLAQNMPWCAYCGRSTRGKGYFLLFRIKDQKRHDDYFLFLQKLFERYGIQIDKKVRKQNALRFVSYDWDAFWNHTPEEFDFVLPPPPKPVFAPTRKKRFEGNPTLTTQKEMHTNDKVTNLCHEIERRRIDITPIYEDWYKLGFALASLGEFGRKLYHVCSLQYPGYKYEETDKKFTNLLRNSDGRITIATFYDICKKYGVTPKKHC